MAIERVQPPSDRSPQWEKKDVIQPKPAQASAAASSHAQAAAHRAGAAKAGAPVRVNPEIAPEKPKAGIDVAQTQIQINEVDQTVVMTQQQLNKATQEQIAGELEAGDWSYWQKLDVVAKARTINHLKDKLQALQLKRHELISTLSEQVQNGTYRVSGAEIAQGIASELE